VRVCTPSTNDQRPTGYNPRTFMIPHRNRLCALLVLALAFSVPAMAQWTEPIAHLAREIAGITGPGTVSLNLRNISSLPADQAAAIRRDLQNQLAAAGVRVVNPTSAAGEVKVTLSENVQGYVWVAEVQQGADRKVAMVSAPRSQAVTPVRNGPSVAIRKTPLWTQDAPILDVAIVTAGNEPHMIVLDPAGVSLYKMAGGRWIFEQQLPIPRTRTWPRDVRGRLVAARDHLFDAYLPGMVCASTKAPPLDLTCRAGDDPWPITGGQTAIFGASRNFFTGVVTPGIGKHTSVPAFYSAAALARSNYTLWVFARADGSVHLMDGVNDVAVRAARDWGSDLATVKSSCGSGTQLLVSGPGDGEAADAVRSFEIADRDPVEVSPAAEFAGPVTALWPSTEGRGAIAVAKNLKTGRFDAFELAITCGQ
jgi:hypothetical protein